MLAYNGLQNAFDIIVGRSDCAARKPHPQPLAIALEKLGIAHPKRALYVGDLQTDDVGAGNALGMKTALIGKGVLDRYGPLPTYHWPDLEKLRRMYGRR